MTPGRKCEQAGFFETEELIKFMTDHVKWNKTREFVSAVWNSWYCKKHARWNLNFLFVLQHLALHDHLPLAGDDAGPRISLGMLEDGSLSLPRLYHQP